MYIGQTTLSVEERYNQHMKPSAHKKNYKIYKAILKYGVENFYFEVLESGIPEDELNEKEIYYIEKYDSFKNGYNSTKGGDGRIFNKIDDIEYIINELKNGRMAKDIADELEVNIVTINRALKSVGIKNSSSIQKRSKRPEIQTINREEIKELYIKGYTHDEISKTLHIDQRSVSRIVKELNIETKNPDMIIKNYII